MKRLLSACLVCALAAATPWAKTNEPDFRFPETVVAEATKQIDKAVGKNDDKKLIDGLIRLSIAKTKISTDYMPELITTVDSLAAAAPSAPAKALLWSLEADMYASMFDNGIYKYSQRKQAGEVPPADIREWSQQDFADKIRSLSDSIQSLSASLLATPVEAYRDIIVTPDVCPEFAPTLYDMLTHHTVEILDEVDPEPETAIATLHGSLLAANKPGTAPYVYTLLQRVGRGRPTADAVAALAGEYASTPYSIELIDYGLSLDNSNEELIGMARKAVAAFPKYARVDALKRWLDIADQRIARVSAKRVVTTVDSIPIEIRTLKNVATLTLKAVEVPDSIDYAELSQLEKLPVAATLTVTPGEAKEVMFPPLPLGRYAILPEFADGDSIVAPTSANGFVRVTDLTVMMTSKFDDELRVYVVDAFSSRPVANAMIHYVGADGKVESSQKVNRLGYAVVGDRPFTASRRFYASKGNDRTNEHYISAFGAYGSGGERLTADIFTDRAVYRPGETLKFAAVASRAFSDSTSEVAKQLSLKVKLLDHNRNAVSETDLITDEFGRVSGEMPIPTEGLTGRFLVTVEAAGDGRQLQTKQVTVSEYKAPTFFVEVNPERCSLSSLDSIRIVGKAMTYSQFPVANATVDYEIAEADTWLRDKTGFIPAYGSVATDAEGCFSITIPAGNFGDERKKTPLEVKLSATDAKGETQTATAFVNAGGTGYICGLSDITTLATEKACVPLRVVDNANQPLPEAEVGYKIVQRSDTVATGKFTPSSATIDLSAIPSGRYDLRLALLSDPAATASAKLTVYRASDTIPPYFTPFFLPEGATVECSADGSFSLPYGSSVGHCFYYVVLNAGNIVDEGMHTEGPGMHRFEGNAGLSAQGAATTMEIFQVWKHETLHTTVTLLPATPPDSIEIVAQTFRDNVVPGSKETWTLKIRNNNGKTLKSAVIANMYDAALNAIASNTYELKPLRLLSRRFNYRAYSAPYQTAQTALTPLSGFNIPEFILPHLKMYGESFFYAFRPYRYYSRANVLDAAAMPMEASASAFSAGDELPVAKVEESGSSGDASEAAPALRDDGITSAFFLPGLVTDSNGEVAFTFDVPDRNTQWQFSAVAYTADMKAAYINRLVSASKPLMVEPNLPRFARSGDRLTLKATVMNNTTERQTVDVMFEFDNGGKLETKVVGGVEIAPMGAATVDVPYSVENGTELICTVTVCNAAGTADGERNRLAILPAVASVIEAEPFYLKPSQKKLTIKLPDAGKTDALTFEYADNAAWYAATALPSLVSKSKTASSIAANYFATATAGGILSANSEIAEAIKTWKGQKSPLLKNEELKTISLSDTPWTRQAETETQTMEKLADLTDPATIQYRCQQALISLSDLQGADGGISWFKDCGGAFMPTKEVLRLMASLNEMGYYDTADALLNRIVTNAVVFCDNHLTEAYGDLADNLRDAFFSYAADYVAIRSSLPVAKPSGAFAEIAEHSLDYTAAHWGDMSAYGKSEAAVTLARNGRSDVAAQIVESLKQTAVKTAGRGMYWDIDRIDKTSTAANALKALAALNPDDAAIDEVRLWLLQQKEAQWWESPVAACNAINALLSTGTKWTASGRSLPRVSVGGTVLETDGATPYFGYIKRSFTLAELAGGEISISRSAGAPAWGAVYRLYNASMDSVGKHASADVRIDKQFFAYAADGSLKPSPLSAFAVGDRVQVRLTIRCERDLDFVALTDERAACFEPVDQIPAYDYQDGVGSYRESRDAATNIFFSSIRKGTYVVSYDVFVNNAGTYASGVATLQCQYAPQLTAHSAGSVLTVR